MTAQIRETPQAVLQLHSVSRSFGPVRVLNDISLDIRQGEVIALLGENGAGKSTISNIIAGVLAPSEGRMFWQGEAYAPASPAAALEQGIALIHQEMKLLPELSVAENVFVGHQLIRHGRVDIRRMESIAEEQLRRLGLNIPGSTLVRTLSVAAQQQVEIAKALTRNARLMILDEPTAALGNEETDYLFSQIERLKKEGVSFIYISHRLDEIARIADRIAVLRDGSLISVHNTAQVPVKELVTEMVGRQVDRMFPELPVPEQEEVLRAENLCGLNNRFRDISFSVRRGEIFGIAGIVGAGRTELVRAIYGADRTASGQLYLNGEKVEFHSPAEAIQAGVVLVPEDRKQQGLITDHLIGDNIYYGNHDLVSAEGWAKPAAVREFTRAAIEKMGVKGTIDQPASSLSGGNQQKVIIGKWIARHPDVFILDEPTRGIDVGARAAIYDVIAELAAQGMAVIVVSSDLDEVLGLSNRVMVLAHGELQGILSSEQADQISVMELATQ